MVASRLIPASFIRDELERTFDELFEEMLITRWRPPARVRKFGDAVVVEDEEAYRFRLALPGADPGQVEVEVSDRRLVVRMLAEHQQRTFDFTRRVEIESVRASFEAGTLEVILPKAGGRKIEVN